MIFLYLYISYCCPSTYSFIQSDSLTDDIFFVPDEITKFDMREIIPGVRQLLLNKFILSDSITNNISEGISFLYLSCNAMK